MGHVYPHSPSSQTVASSSAILRLSLEAPQSMAQGWLTILVPTCSKDSSEKRCCCQFGPWFRSWKTTRMHAHTHTHVFASSSNLAIYFEPHTHICIGSCQLLHKDIYIRYLSLLDMSFRSGKYQYNSLYSKVGETNILNNYPVVEVGKTHWNNSLWVLPTCPSSNVFRRAKPRLGILSRTHLGYQVLQASSLVLSTNEFSPLM